MSNITVNAGSLFFALRMAGSGVTCRSRAGCRPAASSHFAPFGEAAAVDQVSYDIASA